MHVFVTGASGWIGSAVIPILVGSGHHVTGLARSNAAAAAIRSAGAEVVHGTLDDVETLRNAANVSDGVIHLAFKHDIAFSGDFLAAARADRVAVEVFGEALTGTNKPIVLATGLLGIVSGRVATEHDMPSMHGHEGVAVRQGTATIALDLASRGIRSSVVRLAPTVHGDGDQGFMAQLVAIAREKGVSGYLGDGANRWPAVHRYDAAQLFRLALENAPARSVLHAAADEGVPLREIAQVIGRHVGVPVASIAPEDAGRHFTWLAGFVGTDGPASSALTRELLGWNPSQPALLADLEQGHYFSASPK